MTMKCIRSDTRSGSWREIVPDFRGCNAETAGQLKFRQMEWRA